MARDDLLTAEQLAERLTVQPATIRAWARRGRIPRRRLSHKVVRYDLRDVLSALESTPAPQGASR